MKILFAASAGGHWEEIMNLRELEEDHDVVYVTEESGQVQDNNLKNIYCFPKINRKEKLFIIHFIRLFIESRKLIWKENPDVIISTGALMTYPFCLWMKLKGKKVVFIETFARVHNKSLTGKLVYPFADLFLVQWESLLKCYPKAKYIGGLFG